jgi:DNA adenine methylase
MKKNRAFLKWAGGKYSLINPIKNQLPHGKKLIEPFVGAGSVFLNTDYESYLLNDINADLITLYQFVKRRPKTFIQDARKLFTARNNQADVYYALRAEFNASADPYYRSLLFLYMNRHGYNGLCRYNSKGIFNVPFGDYRKPYFPEAELEFFAEKAKRAKFICHSFEHVFRRARKGDVIYCDPPYAPLVQASNFTSYATGGFGLGDQSELARHALRAACKRQIPVLISNHDTPLTRALYEPATISQLSVARSISQKADGRKPVKELLALYSGTLTASTAGKVIPISKQIKKVGT